MDKEIKEELLELYVTDLKKELKCLKGNIKYLELADADMSAYNQTVHVLEKFIKKLSKIKKVSEAKKLVSFKKLYEIYEVKL